MGFYSFYKVFKDMLRTIFGNKFLKLFFIALIILSIIAIKNKVFATSTLTFSYNNNTFTVDNIPDDFNYVFICYDINNNKLKMFCSKQPLTFIKFGTTALKPTNASTDNPYYLVTIINDTNYPVQSPTFNNNNLFTSNFTAGGLYGNYVYSNYDVKVNDVVVHTANDNQLQFINPDLSNTQEQLENLNFSNFIINANSYTQDIENNDGTLFMLFYNRSLSNSQTTDGLYPIKEKGFTKGSIYTDYENSTSDNMIFKFPIFMSGVYFNIGSTYEIRLARQVYNSEYNTMTYQYFGQPIQFTISSNVTQDYINQLNQQIATTTDEEKQNELNNSINEQTNAINNQTQSIDNINNSINDSNVSNDSIQLPTDNTTDPTQSGVDNIFQTIYNSFTSGTPQDIIFPIPFTNKNITLQPNYIYNMLQNNNANWVITIIQAFWWYLISRFIITDIMKKIRKIKQGNFENIQNSNIKEDML